MRLSRSTRYPADNAVGFQVGDLVLAQSYFGEQLVVVLTEQRCRMDMESIWPTGEPHRHGAVRDRVVHRMRDLLEEASKPQLRELGLAVRLHYFRYRDAGAPQASNDLVAAATLTPRAEMLVDEVVALSPASRTGQCRVHCPLGPPQRLT